MYVCGMHGDYSNGVYVEHKIIAVSMILLKAQITCAHHTRNGKWNYLNVCTCSVLVSHTKQFVPWLHIIIKCNYGEESISIKCNISIYKWATRCSSVCETITTRAYYVQSSKEKNIHTHTRITTHKHAHNTVWMINTSRTTDHNPLNSHNKKLHY